jgi:hypothetical protein
MNFNEVRCHDVGWTCGISLNKSLRQIYFVKQIFIGINEWCTRLFTIFRAQNTSVSNNPNSFVESKIQDIAFFMKCP